MSRQNNAKVEVLKRMETVTSLIETHPGGPEMASSIKRAILRLTSDMPLDEAATDALDRFYPDLNLLSLALETSKGTDATARKLLADAWNDTWLQLKRSFS